ncbi:MAG: SDR family oxidoreductase [Deltaproteobacteria bacterium]|nr:SDR family oxidoreductase [Deltaproteobacteria bacterium]MBW2122437.1 SDR family oxidoreductase [Deltaproteobacteria bacterium]
MDLELRDRVALITGGSYGIGRGCAEALAKEGVHVAICARNKEKLDAATREIQSKFGTRALGVVADCSRLPDIENFVKEAARTLGRIDILINNAGTGSDEKIETTPDEKWQHYWDLNTMSAIRCSRAVIPHMKENGWGRIVNISSIYAKQPAAYCPVYNVTKAALMMFSRCLAEELVDYNILVNNVNPGLTRTPLWEYWAGVWGKQQGISADEYMENHARQHTPIKRFCSPEELAQVIVFLCSAKNTYMTGASIDVSGGWVKAIY